ncbi:MAG TPA: hypothetical protein PLW23_03185, partial [Bacteroidales bacterium]|nr:hypothetical protein [Bacteroidales bacterium]
ENFSEEHKHIVRKLQEAYVSSEIRDEMKMEDDYFKELEVKDDIIAEQEKKIAKKDKMLAENAKKLAENAKEIAELKRLLELKNKSDKK